MPIKDELFNYYTSIFNDRERVDFPKISEFNNNRPRELQLHKDILPCYFTGRLKKNKIVSISLNPRYTPRITKNEQRIANGNFNKWLEFCDNRFLEYARDEEIHNIFKNILRCLIGRPLSEIIDRRRLLDSLLINLDFCYYYSRNTHDLYNQLPDDFKTRFCSILLSTVFKLKPKYIFVHSKSLQGWVEEFSTKIPGLTPLILHGHHRGRRDITFSKRRLNEVNGFSCPIFYLDCFVNNANANKYICKIRNYIKI